LKKQNDKTTSTMRWTNRHGKEITREVNLVGNLQDFRGTPGYALLVVAFNTHLSISDIERFLDNEAREFPRCLRSTSWIMRRRWLFQQPGTDNYKDPQADRDGKHAEAIAFIAANRELSVRHLAHLLKQRGIRRSREWCRRNKG
jgi:hypothetical protein